MGGEVAIETRRSQKWRHILHLCGTVPRNKLRRTLHLEPSTPLRPKRGHRMQEPHANPHHARRWLILLVVAIAQLMVVLDATVVNIALPSAQQALEFSNDQRQWVITAYALAFGSLLLLGGRIGDLFGRKRAFVVGLGRLRGRERARRLRAELRGARRRPRAAGRLRRAARAGRALAADDDVRRPRGARQGVRHLRRGRRRRRGDRPHPRRRADRVPQLALVPLREPRVRRPGDVRRRCRC